MTYKEFKGRILSIYKKAYKMLQLYKYKTEDTIRLKGIIQSDN